MAAQQTVIAFDAYGTLLSTESIAKQLSAHFGDEKGSSIAANWRVQQLEYTWRLNSMDHYVDFEQVTKGSLAHALRAAGVSLDDQQTSKLMEAYNSLQIFPDVAKTLELLREEPKVYPVVFSNGTLGMVSASVKESPDLKVYKDVLQDIVVVEEVRKYKPDPAVYHHLARKVGKSSSSSADMSSMWLVSGNPFDIVGARHAGMNAIWVDRAGKGWQDQIVEGELGRPTAIVGSLTEVVSIVTSAASATSKMAFA